VWDASRPSPSLPPVPFPSSLRPRCETYDEYLAFIAEQNTVVIYAVVTAVTLPKCAQWTRLVRVAVELSTAEMTSGSAIAEGPREALVSRNPATTKHLT